MQQANIFEIAQAFSQLGQVALWLGRVWQCPQDAEELKGIAVRDWAGVWAESQSLSLLEAMKEIWQTEGRGRQIVEVPNALADALGSGFKYSDVAPYMFLLGKEAHDPLDSILRQDARLDKIREMSRMENAILLVAGMSDCADAFRAAAEAGRRAGQLRRIVLVGIDESNCREEASRFAGEHAALAGKVVFHGATLSELLKEIDRLTIEPTAEALIRLGNREIPLKPLLQQEPPITQDFAVLTVADISPAPLDGEDDGQLLMNVFAGTACPWRSIARGMTWDKRPELAIWRHTLADAIARVRSGELRIVVIDVEAEPGSGLTTLLTQLAVYAAGQSCPTLYHLAPDVSMSYSRLRTFLTDLFRDIGGSDALVPAVIIFDADSSWADIYGTLDVLPGKLNRDGRRAVIIRAKQSGSLWGESPTTLKSSRDIQVVTVAAPLSEHLSESDATALAAWVEEHYQRLNSTGLPIGWLQRFRALSSEAGCPFLITLSLLLVEQYREVARLGERLLARINRVVSAVETANIPASASVHADDGDGVQQSIQRALVLGTPRTVSRDDFYALSIIMSALGCLRVSAPRRVLAQLADIDPAEVLNVTVLLERAGLVLSHEPATEYWHVGRGYRRTKPATMQLVHHEYGRLLMECFIHMNGRCNEAQAPARAIVSELLVIASELEARKGLDVTAVAFLKPILQRLRPGEADDLEFAEQLAQRFLRVQRQKRLGNDDRLPREDEERTFRIWQWANRQEVLRAFDWLPPEMIRASASMLHSRAITRAKCTLNEHPDQARPLYEGAEADLITALKMDPNYRTDNPAHMLGTLGMIYVHWAHMEREHGESDNRVLALDDLADKTLREAKALQLDSAYPAYHLATHKIDSAEYLITAHSPSDHERAAGHLAEALELLAGEPEPNFRAEWDELLQRAVAILGERGDAVVAQLKKEHKVLGWALEALRELNGEFPREPNPEIGETELTRAWEIIQEGFTRAAERSTPIAALLRYAIFSFRKEREIDPAYDVRLTYIKPIVVTRYFSDEPIWQFDYGMLCYQNGDYESGAKTFRDLRRGQRFFSVPTDRAVAISDGPHSNAPQKFMLQVQSVDSRTGQGWARIVHPKPFSDPVPFSVRAFESRDERVRIRNTMACNVTVRPAGPFAEPVIKR